MIITPPSRFQHAGELSLRVDSADPREAAIPEAELFVDLRPSAFVRPPASLWCVIYLLLARHRDIPCTLWVPTNTGVCIYLKSLGLFGVLQRYGVEVDELGIYDNEDSQLVLPLTRFDTIFEADELTNRANDALKDSGMGAANLYPVVSETFGELAMDAVEHSESPIGAYGVIQFYESEFGQRFVCAVADGGIGIRRSLEKNPELRRQVPQDWQAVKLATQERIVARADGRAVGTNWHCGPYERHWEKSRGAFRHWIVTDHQWPRTSTGENEIISGDPSVCINTGVRLTHHDAPTDLRSSTQTGLSEP